MKIEEITEATHISRKELDPVDVANIYFNFRREFNFNDIRHHEKEIWVTDEGYNSNSEVAYLTFRTAAKSAGHAIQRVRHHLDEENIPYTSMSSIEYSRPAGYSGSKNWLVVVSYEQ
jgi:hypothetical protein